jgi:hypothetical protein
MQSVLPAHEFSFMTEIPFVVAILASYFAFACMRNRLAMIWLWLAAICATVGFAIRPFAAATILGEAAALLIFTLSSAKVTQRSKLIALIPLMAALLGCAGFWVWSTVINPEPWMLQYHEYRLRHYLTLLPIQTYTDWGILEPAIYLGTVLSPLAVLHAARYWRRNVMIMASILALSLLWGLNRQNPDQFGCFGGSLDSLVLSGSLPQPGFSPWLSLLLERFPNR